MTAPLRVDRYDWRGGREAMLRFGRDDGPIVVVALPLWEEANRTRALAAAMLRRLADRGIGGVLPDWPGTGDSLVATADLRLPDLCAAHRALLDGLGAERCHAVGIRSGALIDGGGAVASRWHLAPSTGPELLRDLGRLHAAAGGTAPLAGPATVAGNRISAAMLADLAAPPPSADRVPLRTIRLAHDPRPADRHYPGSALWRRAEPGNDAVLAGLLATDIADWIAACAA